MECAAITDIICIIEPRLLPKTDLAKSKLKSIVNISDGRLLPKLPDDD
jgi:hypothetical protein